MTAVVPTDVKGALVGDAVRPEDLRKVIIGELVKQETGSTLPGVCRRLGVPHPESPNGMGSASKSVYVRACLEDVDGPALVDLAVRVVSQVGSTELDEMLRTLGPRGADGRFRNLIFGGITPKPDLVLTDSVDNTLRLEGKNAPGWLYYGRPLPSDGLSWLEMIGWWRETEPETTAGKNDAEVCRLLYTRFKASLDKRSPPEHYFFEAYCARIKRRPDGLAQPALLPQIHLHYDPYTRRQRGGESVLARERMDFLMLLPNKVRVVLEIDGDTHYGTEERHDVNGPHLRRLTNPRAYAKMVAEDRRLRLAGYEVYRFGGAELPDSETAVSVVDDFFDRLLEIMLR